MHPLGEMKRNIRLWSVCEKPTHGLPLCLNNLGKPALNNLVICKRKREYYLFTVTNALSNNTSTMLISNLCIKFATWKLLTDFVFGRCFVQGISIQHTKAENLKKWLRIIFNPWSFDSSFDPARNVHNENENHSKNIIRYFLNLAKILQAYNVWFFIWTKPGSFLKFWHNLYPNHLIVFTFGLMMTINLLYFSSLYWG